MGTTDHHEHSLDDTYTPLVSLYFMEAQHSDTQQKMNECLDSEVE